MYNNITQLVTSCIYIYLHVHTIHVYNENAGHYGASVRRMRRQSLELSVSRLYVCVLCGERTTMKICVEFDRRGLAHTNPNYSVCLYIFM